MSRTWSFVVVLSLLCSLAIAQEPRETPQQRAERILEQQTNAECVETPFGDVLTYLAKKHELPMELSPEATRAGLVKAQERVTLSLKDMTLRSCIYFLSDKYGLNYTIKPDGTVQLIPATKENLAARIESKAQLAAKARLLKLMQDKVAEVAFIDTPLRDVLAFLGDFHECNFSLDPRADVGALGLADEPCSLFSATLPLGKTLEGLLAPLHLQAIVRHEMILITKRDAKVELARSLEVEKAYDLEIDLVRKKRSILGLAKELTIQAKVPVVCDYRAFRAAKIDISEPIVFDAKKVPLRDVLKSLPAVVPALKFADRDGVILITP